MVPLNNCIGFIDCTKIQVSRPGRRYPERTFFWPHAVSLLSYQTITTPDGLVFNMHGPEDGRRHDTTLYRKSDINHHLSQCLTIHGDPPRQFCIQGDAAYILRQLRLQVGFSPLSATSEQLLYNAEMSAVRVAVEWSYKDVKEMWTTKGFKRKLKVRESPVAVLYIMSALLWNCKVCFQHGSQAGSKFHCDPPSFSEYTRTE
jgi:nuclease HARBI1